MNALKFESTQWSLVMAAGHRSSPEGRLAFSRLCEKYWYPLYAHVRKSEQDPDRARDLTQGFFERVIEKNYIADVDPRRGRFRTFLLASLTHYIANEVEKSNAIKRGGERLHLSLEFQDGERRYIHEPADEETPERVYERRWAIALLKQVLLQLRSEYAAKDKEELFTELQQFLTASENKRYAEVCERINMNEGAVKTAVHRLRTRYREVLRMEIVETLADPNEVDDEIRSLFETFRR